MPLATRWIFLMLLCLACAGHGRRVQIKWRSQDGASEHPQLHQVGIPVRASNRSTSLAELAQSLSNLRFSVSDSSRIFALNLAILLVTLIAPVAAFQIMLAAGRVSNRLGSNLAMNLRWLSGNRGESRARVVMRPNEQLQWQPVETTDVYFGRRSPLERALAFLVALCPLLWGLRGSSRRLTFLSAVIRILTAVYLHFVVSSLQLDMRHRPKMLVAEDLAEKESRFGSFPLPSGEEELQLHWIQHSSGENDTSGNRCAGLVHCNHGFGANALSWRSSMHQGLGKALGASEVVAHDTPGFGLTERPTRGDGASFTIAGNSHFTLELVRSTLGEPQEEAGTQGAHFVGHSMGALTAMRAAIDWCETRSRENSSSLQRPTMLVLVAPAIPAPRASAKASKRRQASERQVQQKNKSSLRAVLSWLRRRVLAPIVSPLMRLLLRRAVFTGGFWEFGVKMSCGSGFHKTEAYRQAVSEYSLPSRVRGWEDGMLRFVVGRLREGITAGSADLVARAAELAEQGALRVLIVHGARDPILPYSNSVKLSGALGPSTVFVGGQDASWNSGTGTVSIDFQDCGHVPHEEATARFVQVVGEWAEPLIASSPS